MRLFERTSSESSFFIHLERAGYSQSFLFVNHYNSIIMPGAKKDQKLVRNGKMWTRTEINEAVRLYKEGNSWKTIGNKLGRTPDAVQQRIYLLRQSGELPLPLENKLNEVEYSWHNDQEMTETEVPSVKEEKVTPPDLDLCLEDGEFCIIDVNRRVYKFKPEVDSFFKTKHFTIQFFN